MSYLAVGVPGNRMIQIAQYDPKEGFCWNIQEMLAAVKELASQRGFLQPDGRFLCPINKAVLLTARA